MVNSNLKICMSISTFLSILFMVSLFNLQNDNTTPVVVYRNFSKESIKLPAKRPTCEPINRIVYLKTHKTAGTTLSTIIQRYGYTRNLTFAIPAAETSVFNCFRYFKGKDVYQYAKQPRTFEWGKTGADFHILSSHTVYNRPEMEATVPNALYITSVRDPVDQFESAFWYFDMAKQAGIEASKNPISVFLLNSAKLRKRITYGTPQVQNGQLYDLGFMQKDFSNPFDVKYKIKQLDNEFDLVIITEYFDESLILMKKMLCWKMDDILYIPKRTRQSQYRYNMSESLRQSIHKWNRADGLLYQHFNKTLWRKIEEYGPDFWRELEEFRARVAEITLTCSANQSDSNRVVKDNKHHIDIVKLTNGSQMCRELYRYDGEYVGLIRHRMRLKEQTVDKIVTGTKSKTIHVANSNLPVSVHNQTHHQVVVPKAKPPPVSRRRVALRKMFKRVQRPPIKKPKT